MAHVRQAVTDRVAKLGGQGKRASAVFSRRRACYNIADEQHFVKPPVFNDLFNRLCMKSCSTNAQVSVPLEELRRLESAVVGLQEAQSFSFWLVSSLFGYVKESGFVPPDPALYSRLSSSLSMSLVHQCTVAHAVSAFSTSLRRGHFLSHCSPTVTDDQKHRLLASPPFAEKLFDPVVLKEVVEEYEGASATAHNVNVSKALIENMSRWFGKKGKDTSAPGVPGPSGVSPAAPASSSEQPKAGSPLFDASAKGGVYWPRSNRGKGRGGRRGKGGSRFSKTKSGFQK